MYKPYKISLKSSHPKTLEPTFVQDEINNLDKYMKFIQSPVKRMPFHPLPHYKSLQPQGEQDEQYWNKIAIKFLKNKYSTNTTRKGFPIEMYMRGPPHESYLIVLTLQGKIIIRLTKKLVTSHIVRDLALLNQFMGT